MVKNSLTTHKINMLASLINNEAESILRVNFRISYNEYLLLLHIEKNIETSQVFLANCTNLTKGAVSKILTLLAKRKIVQITASKTSGRTNVVSLTSLGKTLVVKATKFLEKSFINFYKSFESKTKIQNFDEQLTNIIDKLSEHYQS